MRTWAAIVAAVACLGCNDRTREIPPVSFEPRVDDMGEPDIGTTPEPMPDGICDDELDGTSCELPQARGVCVNQRCTLTTCETGFGDCDDAPGCETAFDAEASCGGCDVQCAPDQACKLGPAGFACAAGILCPTDQFDLDSDDATGCEWQAEWEEPYALAPVGLDVQAAGWGTAPLLAGGDGDARVSVELGAAPQVTVWPEPLADARAVDVTNDGTVERVVWSDGVSLRLVGPNDVYFLQPPCDPATVPRRFVAAAGDLVATQYEVFRVNTSCSDTDPCLELVFGVADYHDQRLGEFTPPELAMCDGCANALPDECWGLEQCRGPTFDPMVCVGCDVGGCPSFDVVDLVEVGSELAIITARGVLLYDPATGAVRGYESEFDPLVGGGPRFVRAVGAPGALSVFHSTGYLRVMDDELTSIFPDVGVNFDPESAQIAAQGDALIAVVGDDAQILVPGARSARTAFLDLASAPRIQGLRAVATVATPDGLRVFYQASGQLFTRRVFSF